MRTLILLLLLSLFIPAGSSFAGVNIIFQTDNAGSVLIAPFDLRDRESYLQITNVDFAAQNMHIQIYNVGNLCNENNFFDLYTPNDTHVYNLRDILTNDGNPSGVVLPEDAYGIIVVAPPFPMEEFFFPPVIGNFRILDNTGYEYRSNAVSNPLFNFVQFLQPQVSFNYNSENGVILSDVFGIAFSSTDDVGPEEATLDNVLGTFVAVDVDIINNNEVLFSCRDVVFSCVDENNPLNEEILALASSNVSEARSSASVVRYEYGINNVVPNSKGGELLCPGNTIPEGHVILTLESAGEDTDSFFGYVGLNNGNGRGSMDSMFFPSTAGSTDQM